MCVQMRVRERVCVHVYVSVQISQEYTTSACTTTQGAPVQMGVCTRLGTNWLKKVCSSPITASYAGQVMQYSDSTCSTLTGTKYYGLPGVKANQCMTDGSDSVKISCTASTMTISGYSGSNCAGTARSQLDSPTTCVRTVYTFVYLRAWSSCTCENITAVYNAHVRVFSNSQTHTALHADCCASCINIIMQRQRRL